VNVTSVADGLTHTISAHEFDLGVWHGAGQYRAECGVEVIADALASEPDRAADTRRASSVVMLSATTDTESPLCSRQASERRSFLRILPAEACMAAELGVLAGSL
jgi:hypothetical protein